MGDEMESELETVILIDSNIVGHLRQINEFISQDMIDDSMLEQLVDKIQAPT